MTKERLTDEIVEQLLWKQGYVITGWDKKRKLAIVYEVAWFDDDREVWQRAKEPDLICGNIYFDVRLDYSNVYGYGTVRNIFKRLAEKAEKVLTETV
jgi:hypothetical protein